MGPGPKVSHLGSPDRIEMDTGRHPVARIMPQRGITLEITTYTLEVRIFFTGPGPKVGHLESQDGDQTDPKMDPTSLIGSKRGFTFENAMHSLEVKVNLYF